MLLLVDKHVKTTLAVLPTVHVQMKIVLHVDHVVTVVENQELIVAAVVILMQGVARD